MVLISRGTLIRLINHSKLLSNKPTPISSWRSLQRVEARIMRSSGCEKNLRILGYFSVIQDVSTMFML